MGAAELLKREQLKNIVGGSGLPNGGSGYANYVTCYWTGAIYQFTPPIELSYCNAHIEDWCPSGPAKCEYIPE